MLFEGGYYLKYRRRGYYLFQLYRNAATIRGQLLFEVQTSRLLFISALPQCGDYLRAATIQSTDVAATIYFSATAMRLLFEGGYYSKYRRRGYYLFQRYRNAATIQGRLLFEVQTSQLLFISALPQCGDYSRAATIRSTDVAATIYFSATAMRRLFEGGYYSRCGVYSRKYGIYIYILIFNCMCLQLLQHIISHLDLKPLIRLYVGIIELSNHNHYYTAAWAVRFLDPFIPKYASGCR